MSIQYYHYLCPDDLRYRLSPEQLECLIADLVATGWVDPAQLAYRAHAYGEAHIRNSLRVGHVALDFATLAKDVGGLLVQLPIAEAEVIPGDNRIFSEMPPGTPLGIRQCQGFDLLVAERLCVVPGGEMGSEVPCESCREDLLTQLLNPPPTQWSMIAPEVEGRLATCASCGHSVDFDRLIGYARRASDGAMAEEPPPFFRFAVCLTSDSPPDPDRAVTDPGLTALLEQVTGQSFRAFPRWG
jgi:hypothetical protein